MKQIGGSYHSPEKQKIREELWDKAFEDLIHNENVSESSIKYFCLPGSECIYLKQILDKFDIRKSNIVAAEQYSECAIPIRKFLNGKGPVIEGKLKDICEKGKLDNAFPFDVINLDFCGQAFVFKKDGYPNRWEVIKYFIKKNSKNKKNIFHLLITIRAARDPSSGIKYLESMIQELNEISKISPSRAPSQWKNRRESKLIQMVLPSIIIVEALDYNYVLDLDEYKSLSYQQAGHPSVMAAFSFKLKYNKEFEKLLGPAKSKRKEELRKKSIREYYMKEPKELQLGIKNE